jgi:CDP-6-deoxy-D-xylo-4-hexulose-3-dehydrase
MSNFSFYFGHHITTIEGGAVCTDNPEIHEYTRLYRSHGLTREASPAFQERYEKNYPRLNPLFTFAVPGSNLRSMEMNAVLGLEQLHRLDSNIQHRVENMECWVSHLDSNRFYTDYALEGNSNFALPLILQETDRELLCRVAGVLEEVGVEYRLGTAGGGNQAHQPYLVEGQYEYRISGRLDTADYIHDYGLYIGNHTDLTGAQIIDLCERLNNV